MHEMTLADFQSFFEEKRGKISLAFGCLGVVILGVLAVFIWWLTAGGESDQPVFVQDEEEEQSISGGVSSSCCIIELAGAVTSPGLHHFVEGSRLGDVIAQTGGFHSEADAMYIAKELQLARKVSDQEKIYIPFFTPEKTENVSLNGNELTSDDDVGDEMGRVSVNTATEKELDALPYIGEVTIKKILSQRPFSSLEDFFTKIKFSESRREELELLLTL